MKPTLNPTLRHAVCASLLGLLLTSPPARADIVYVTGRPSPSGTGANPNGTYTELIAGSDTSAASTAVGVPPRDGCRFFSSSTFSNSMHQGVPFLRLTPTLGTPGGVYRVHYSHSSTANNTTQDAIAAVSNAALCTLSFTNTDAFQRKYGQPAPQAWQFLGYLTNDPGSATPTLEVYLVSSTNINSTSARFPVDAFRFILNDPCLDIPVVAVTGPLSTNLDAVVVTGVSASATNINIYQDTGSGMVLLGAKTTGVTAGNNTVTVSGLVKLARVAATQTINGQEGCVPTSGTLVGGGANPSIRIALSLREAPATAAVGAPGIVTNTSIHFLGATTLSAGAPTDSPIYSPSANWQTVTFDRGTIKLGVVTNLAAATADGPGYSANDVVSVRVYAYQTGPLNSIVYYSPAPAQSVNVTSNDQFSVNWTWDPVPGAEGYRVLRQLNANGYTNNYVDVIGVNNLVDANVGWAAGLGAVTPDFSQTNGSIRWSPSSANLNNIPGHWATLDAIAFTIDDAAGDVGPYDIYIDNLKNGTTTWQTFENSVAGANEVSFRVPGFSGTTSGNLLTAPNVSQVSNLAADEGTKSVRVRWEWSSTNSTRWLRLTTSGVGNPQIFLDDPISFRMLLLPVNATPVAPPAPTLSINKVGANQVLTWTGAHQLQGASLVTGTYTNIPSATLAPWTNNLTSPEKFFRLIN